MTVDIDDLVIISLAYGSAPGDVKWEPRADLNADGLINEKDLSILKNTYGIKP